MAIAVMKFGGRSLATTRHLKKVAAYLAERAVKDSLAVVVSAMGSQTDELGAMARKVVKKPCGRELDMLLTAGERITMSLLAMALCEKGVKARSFTGSQVGIHTDESYNNARILFVRGHRLRQTLDAGEIPIVAGFQGVSAEGKEVTTLGRGGSDTTAVALARFLEADSCELYKAVKGFCAADPETFPRVKKVDRITYSELVELSDYGARILHPRAASLAMRYKVPLEVKSSRNPHSPGLKVRQMEIIEERFVRAVTHMKGLIRFTVKDVPKNPEVITQAISRIADAGVRIFFYSHGHPQAAEFDLAFVVSRDDFQTTGKILEAFKRETGAVGLSIMKGISAVSLVGPGSGKDSLITKRAFKALREEDVHIEAFTTSELKLTFFLRARSLSKAIERLLDEFNLMERLE
ncbi:aspartate kinase [candidate division WOR-3 bacterium]|uniref:Aspartokinase n=1 Tax=candidate division WOR-3 bacterium TaxID=2052148 RepID=A0A9D5K7Y9_UNCW3|nr:aspartate kinase [candidate division WOR-3 bacterium]MBD3364038.1 aspartate kinase [candidate division WOR-3 bacterium]